MQEWWSILAALAVFAGLVAAVVVAWRRYSSSWPVQAPPTT